MSQKNLDEFLALYNEDGRHPVTEIELPAAYNGTASPFIIIRSGNRTMIVNPIAFDDHLSVDCHSFVDGEAATAGAFGMSNGHQTELEHIGTMSHGWPSAALISVLLGKQSRA